LDFKILYESINKPRITMPHKVIYGKFNVYKKLLGYLFENKNVVNDHFSSVLGRPSPSTF
jgi:hypothetical protein